MTNLLGPLRGGIRAHRQLFLGAVAILSAVLWVTACAAAWFAHDVITDLPGNDSLRGVESMAQSTTLLDIHDRPAFTIFKEQRIEVPISEMSRHLIRAIVAVEDQRFFEHGGVDVVRVAGAALRNLREGRVAEGGSTITQQLARQTFLNADETLRRKLKEAFVAQRLEREFSKQEILEIYLNKVYFGDGLYGVEAASLGFFGKHAADLRLAEAALLAGLVKSPSSYAPTINSERALARRNVVLERMRDAGTIDAVSYRHAAAAPLVLNDVLRREETFAQYFREEVRKQLVQQFGWERVYQGGLRVYTTLDPDIQKAAESEVKRALAEIESRQLRRRHRGKVPARPDEPLQAALVALDPRSGEVRAMVGGRNFAQSPFNRAVQARRLPGSAFKPFVYAAALERGYTPASLITGLNVPIQTYEGAWTPDDAHSADGSITMRAALRSSSNRAAVRMLEEVGIPETVHYAQRLGVGSVPSVPSLALGSGEVTLLGITAAFGAFGNQGVLFTPTLIRRVETNDGQVLFNGAARPQRVLSEATAFIMTSMMADVVSAGTAWQVRREGFTLPAAGKTGTTNDYHDAWFIGYTPSLAAGVWIGYDRPRTIMAKGYAGTLAVPLWGRFMKTATRNDEPEPFRPPATVTAATICRMSGKLAGDGYRSVVSHAADGTLTIQSMAYTEYFVRGTEPVDFCPYHSVTDFAPMLGTAGTGDVLLPPPLLVDRLNRR